MSIINSIKIPSFARKAALTGALALAAFSQKPYVLADEPSKPVEEMTQQEFEAKRKKDAEAMQRAEEDAAHDAVLADLKREIAEAEAEKKAEAERNAQPKTIEEKLDIKTYQITPEACRCPVPGDTHNGGYVRAFGAKEMSDSGFDGTFDAKIPVGKGISLFGRFDFATQKGFEGDAKSTRKEYSALFGISGDTTVRINLAKQLGTLDHKTSEHTVLVESPLIEQDVTVDESTDIAGTVYSGLFKQNINNLFSFEVGGFSKKTVETAETRIRSDTYGFVSELLEFTIDNKTSYVDQGGNLGIEANLADGFLLGAKVRYIHSNTRTSIHSPYIDEKVEFTETQFQPILSGRYKWMTAEVGGNINKEAEDRLILGLAGVIPVGKLMFLPRAGLNRTAGRGYASLAIMFNHADDHSDSDAQQFLSWDIARHEGAHDQGLTRRQVRDLQFDRLAQLVNVVPGTYFSAGVDTPHERYHEYTFRLASDAGKIIPGLSLAAEATFAREYKYGRMRISENLGGGFTVYIEGGLEKNDAAKTSVKNLGIGAQIEWGGK